LPVTLPGWLRNQLKARTIKIARKMSAAGKYKTLQEYAHGRGNIVSQQEQLGIAGDAAGNLAMKY
jgi:hypothetical protein